MPDEGLSAGAVARRLGVAVTTLRTWHQRYGLGPSQHIPGRHRRYTPEDMARLEVMRRLTAQGVPPAQAARWARGSTGPDTVSGQRPPAAAPAQSGSPPISPAGAGAPDVTAPGARDGGGHTIPVGRAGPAARGLARAGMRLDAAAVREIIQQAVSTLGVIGAWDNVLRPVLAGIGQRHAATKRLVEVEHMISRCTSEVLGAVPRPVPRGRPPRILLACADEEQHSLPFEALAAALAERGLSCRSLGARVPPTALAAAVARTGPTLVMVWSHTAETARPEHLERLLAGPDRPLVVVAAGPGWDPRRIPEEVAVPRSLGDAVRIATSLADRDDRPMG